MNDRHDASRFYHCECLEEGVEHDSEIFYHCDCIENNDVYPIVLEEERKERVKDAVEESMDVNKELLRRVRD